MTNQQREIVDSIEPPTWLKRSADAILWVCAPFQLATLASKLTPELIERMTSEGALEWYNYLSKQYVLILSLRPSSVFERTWIAHMRKSAEKLEGCIVHLWERSQNQERRQGAAAKSATGNEFLRTMAANS